MFQPFANGKPAGKLVVFAKGSGDGAEELDKPAWRPSGLALGPDGALYIGDDLSGRIWRVTYRGATDRETAARS
jgi:glucose/arabinose dehydrogenase